MKYEEIIAHFGTQAAVADKIGITKAAVNHWKSRGGVPVLRQYQLQQVTRGKLKVAKP